MLLPFIAWAVTGVFFFFKPGYDKAYQPLTIKTYPTVRQVKFPEDNNWLEVRQFKTVLGEHLLVNDSQSWQQLSIVDFTTLDTLTKQQITLLIEDAISEERQRYGNIISVNELVATTDTGVEITLAWPQMTLRQVGQDTQFINTMYNIHYLRWTGVESLDKVLGVIGLALVVILAVIGTVLTFKRRQVTRQEKVVVRPVVV